MSTSSDARPRPMMAAVNEAIDCLHQSLRLADSDFFCECGHVGCRERITLNRAEYASLLKELRPLIAPAHADRASSTSEELHALRGHVHRLEGALQSRVNIEQAKGVMAERHGMTPDDAFETIRGRARSQRRALDEVCAEIVARAGTLEGVGRPAERDPRASGALRSSERRGR